MEERNKPQSAVFWWLSNCPRLTVKWKETQFLCRTCALNHSVTARILTTRFLFNSSTTIHCKGEKLFTSCALTVTALREKIHRNLPFQSFFQKYDTLGKNEIEEWNISLCCLINFLNCCPWSKLLWQPSSFENKT